MRGMTTQAMPRLDGATLDETRTILPEVVALRCDLHRLAHAAARGEASRR